MIRRVASTAAALALVLATGACVALRGDAPRPATGSPATSRPGVAYPNVTLLVATDRGDVIRVLPDGTVAKVASPCSGEIVSLAAAPDRSRVAAVCAAAAGRGTIALVDMAALTVTPTELNVPPRSDVVAWSPDGRSLAVLGPGACRPDAPVCDVHVSVYDPATRSQREIRADEPMTGGLLWTRLGLAVYRPAAPSAGTLLWDGRSWPAYSERQLVIVADDGRALLEEHPVGTARGGAVWLRAKDGSERKLTRGGDFEIAAALTGRAGVTWRDSASGGSFVEYVDGRQSALVATSLACTRPVVQGDWVFCAGGGHIEALDVVRMATVSWPGALGESIRDLIVERP